MRETLTAEARQPASESGGGEVRRSPTGRLIRLGWKLLPLSSVLFVLPGIGFVLSARPARGPYREGEAYPFGTELQTWQVTVGFDWFAFAILFAAAAVATPRIKSGWFRAALGVSWLLIWLPHVTIGLAFALDRWFFSG